MLTIAAFCLALRVPHPSSSLRFSKDHQRVTVPYQRLLDFKGEHTIEAWIFPEPSIRERYFNYILSRNYGDQGYGLVIQGGETKTLPGLSDSILVGKWTHLAVASSRRVVKVYIDGKLASAQPGDHRAKRISLALKIGDSDFSGVPGGQPTGFRGRIAEVRIWKVALNQAQIDRRMNRYLSGRERGLVGYFPLCEGKGQIAHDYSGRLISGSLGDSFLEDANDPEWAEGPPLLGGRPRLHRH